LGYIRGLALNNIHSAQDKYLSYYNTKARPRTFNVGDQVWIRTHFLSNAAKGFSAALLPKREGPYTVTNIVSANVYALLSEDGSRVNKIHINKLTPYFRSQNKS